MCSSDLAERIFDCGGAGNDPEPAIEIALGDRKVRALLDTGASRLVMLPERMLGELPLESGPVEGGEATGPQAGKFRPQEARMKGDLRFGAFSVRNPLLTFHRRPRAFLGSALLEHFAVTLDQKTHRVRFQSTSTMPINVPKAGWE